MHAQQSTLRRPNWAMDPFPGGEGPGPIDKKVDADFKNSFPDPCDESDMRPPRSQ